MAGTSSFLVEMDDAQICGRLSLPLRDTSDIIAVVPFTPSDPGRLNNLGTRVSLGPRIWTPLCVLLIPYPGRDVRRREWHSLLLCCSLDTRLLEMDNHRCKRCLQRRVSKGPPFALSQYVTMSNQQLVEVHRQVNLTFPNHLEDIETHRLYATCRQQ